MWKAHTHTHMLYTDNVNTNSVHAVQVCVSVQMRELEGGVNMLSLDVSTPINWWNQLIKLTDFTLVFTESE